MTEVVAYRVRTFSGSVYEVLPTAQYARRINGVIDPTPRQGPDGEWKHFHNHPSIEVGEPMIFDWDGLGHCTLSSNVTQVDTVTVELSLVPGRSGEPVP